MTHENHQEGDEKTTDHDKAIESIKEMFFKAQEAAEIVQDQQPAITKLTGRLPPGAPSLTALSKGALSSAATLRAAALKPKGDFKLPTGGIKHSVVTVKAKGSMPIMRGRTTARGPGSGMMKAAAQKRPHSNPPNLPSKKQRLSPVPSDHQTKSIKSATQTDDGKTTTTTSAAPPPSVLSFLAKLNKKNNGRETSASSKEEKEDKSSEDEKEAPKLAPDPHPNARRNPARGSHPNRK
jgi:hypothetical protein